MHRCSFNVKNRVAMHFNCNILVDPCSRPGARFLFPAPLPICPSLSLNADPDHHPKPSSQPQLHPNHHRHQGRELMGCNQSIPTLAPPSIQTLILASILSQNPHSHPCENFYPSFSDLPQLSCCPPPAHPSATGGIELEMEVRGMQGTTGVLKAPVVGGGFEPSAEIQRW